MTIPPPAGGTVMVALARGGKIKLWLCPVCQKPEISARDEEKLRREKVQLGRCRCTAAEKATGIKR